MPLQLVQKEQDYEDTVVVDTASRKIFGILLELSFFVVRFCLRRRWPLAVADHKVKEIRKAGCSLPPGFSVVQHKDKDLLIRGRTKTASKAT